MKCQVCGQEYGLAHNCAGVAPALTAEEAAPAPDGFAPLYYFRLAFKIACWDEVSIRCASKDFQAGVYGGLLWTAAVTVILLVSIYQQLRATVPAPGANTAVILLVSLALGLVLMAVITTVQIGLIHLLARWFFGATGTFVGVLRPLLLAWFVNLLVLVPVVGMLASGLAWTAALMLVFEEVDGIERFQAFLLAAGINFGFMALLWQLGA